MAVNWDDFTPVDAAAPAAVNWDDFTPVEQREEPKGFGARIAEFGLDLGKRMTGAVIGGAGSIPLGIEKGAKAAVRSAVSGGAETVMPSSVWMPGLDTDASVFGPETSRETAARELAGERAASAVPSFPGAQALAGAGKRAQEAINATTSQGTQDAVAGSQITGNIFKGEIDFGADPSVRGYVMQAADVFGSMLPVVATALATRRPDAAGAVGGAMAAGEGAQNAEQFIGSKTDAELQAESPFYARMREGGATVEEARRLTLDRASESAALLQGVVAAAGDRFTGKLVTGKLDGLLSRAAGRSVAGRVAAGTALSGVEEGMQEVGEGLASDVGIAAAVPSKEIGEDSAANLVLGALGGGPVGGARGAVSGLRERRGGAADQAAGQPPAAQADGAPPAAGAIEPAPAERAVQPQEQGEEPTEAERALRAPTQLTALDRAQAIDSELAGLRERQVDLTPENGYGPAFDAERQDLATQTAELERERAAISATWPRATPGAATSFSTEAGVKLDGQYALMDADDLQTSHDEYMQANPLYPAELQPRDRGRHASEIQVQGISQKLDPARLGVSADAATGAPIVGADGLVESGNGRTIALKRIYRVPGAKAAEYRQWLRDSAAQFGLSAEAVEGMAKPVLVRVRSTPVNRAEFARQANASTVQRMAPSEQALSDARRLTSLEGLQSDDDGDFSGSRDFIRQFMAGLPITEQADLVEADGRLSTAGYRRIQNAVLAKAYGDSATLRRMTESLDNNLANISKALTRVAPTIAAARERMDAGTLHQADIAPDLLQAVEGLSALKEKGWTAAQELGQQDLAGPRYTPEAAMLLEFLADNARSPRRIAEFLQRYYEELERSGDPSQPSMFGDDTPAPARGELLKQARGPQDGDAAQNPKRGIDREGARADAQAGGKPTDAPGGGRGYQGDATAQADAGRGQQGEQQGQAGERQGAWVAFPPGSGTLGIPRAEMPQVKAEHRGAMVQFLRARGIDYVQDEMAPDRLRPTQAEYAPGKVERAGGQEGERSVLVAADGHILDGHHQWMAHKEAGTPVPVLRFAAPIGELLQVTTEFPSVENAGGATRVQPEQNAPAVHERDAVYENQPYQTDLFGVSLPKQQDLGLTGGDVSAGRRADRPARSDESALRRDVQPGASVRDTDSPAGEFFVNTYVGSETSRKLGASVVQSAAQAAAATRYLYESAVERFDGIVTDTEGRPLAVIGGFKGALAQAAVYPATLMGEAVRIPGAARIWFSHNHPSGDPQLSSADVSLFSNLRKVFEGSGIEPMGLLAVGNGMFQSVDSSGRKAAEQAIPDAGTGVVVPVVERKQATGSVPGFVIDSPMRAKSQAQAFYEKSQSPGFMLLNSQMAVAGWVPISDAMQRPLRGGALNAIYRAVSQGNGGAAIIVHGGELGRSGSFADGRSASANIAAALQGVDVRPLDVIDVKAGTSAAELGMNIAAPSVLSRGGEAGGVPVTDLQALVDRVRPKAPNLPAVHVLKDPADAPYALRAYINKQDAWHDVDGAMHEGELYLFAANLPSIERAEHVLIEHEAGHFGLRAILGRQGLHAAMNLIWAQNARVRREATKLQQRGSLSDSAATEEVIVDIPSAELAQLKGWRKVVLRVRDWLASRGYERTAERLTDWLNGSLSDQQRADLFVADLMRAARDYVAGKRPGSPAGYLGVTRLSGALADALAARAGGAQSQPALSRSKGGPAFDDSNATVVADFLNDSPLKAHPDYKAAKAGDVEAAVRLVRDLVKPESLAAAREQFGPDAVFVPVHAEEASGRNKIPDALAMLYASHAGASVARGFSQTNRAFHTGADAMQRLIARAEFDGRVEAGRRYVLVDDVTTMGSTLADLAAHIQREGGDVAGSAVLVNAMRGGKMAAPSKLINQLEARHGEAIRELFGFGPASLTAAEAQYLIGFRTSDELRTRVATARSERRLRLSAKGVPGREGAGRDTRLSRAQPAGTPSNDLTPAQRAAWERVAAVPKAVSMRDRLAALKANIGVRMRQGLVDQFAPIADVSQEAYMQARLSKGADGTMEAALLYGKPFLRDGVPDVDINDGGFAKVLASLHGEHDRFLMWVAAHRADRLQAEGKENLFTSQDISALKTLAAGQMPDGADRPTIYRKALADLNAFNDSVLKIAVESGLVDPEARALFKDQPYVPFYRAMEEGGMQGPKFSSGLVNQKAWKTLKGGAQKLNADLLENMLLNWSHLYAASARNRAALVTMDAAEHLAIAHKVPSDTKGAIRVMRDGQAEHWAVEDPYLLEAITALNYTPSPLMKPLAKAKQLLTWGVTVNPTFRIRNLIRDSLSAISQADLSYNPLANIAQGWKATSKDSQTFASMIAGGGVIRFGTTENTERVRNDIAKLGGEVLDADGWGKLSKMASSMWDAYQEVGDRAENTNRAALYEQLIKKGHSHAEASFASRDLMDFSMSGRWTVVRFLTQSVPFLNARLQGLYKLGRAANEDPRRFATMALAVSLASVALWAAYSDDDDWKKREDHDRDSYWWFKIGSTAFRIPKPFELGAIGTIAERSAEWMLDSEMTGKRYRERIAHMFAQTFSLDPMPQLFKPLLEVYANRDGFSGRAIESMGDERLRPQDRVSERTSEIARFLGRLGLPEPLSLLKGDWKDLSPKQVDHLLRGYFAWLGTSIATVGDLVSRPLLDRGERPAMRLKDVFLLGNFVETLPSGSSRYVSAMYEQAKAIEQAHASYRDALKRGDKALAAEIKKEDGKLLKAYPKLSNAKEVLAEINAQARRVEASKKLTAEQKRERLQKLEQRRHKVAQRISGALNAP